jgi:N-methylhydantoinase A/oxoprolinase/acetone carboxylase beta subunit
MKRDILVGVDVGGTFTDVVLIVGNTTYRAKAASTAVTNVIASRSGMRLGLLTTLGFEETLRLARGRTQEEIIAEQR